MFHVPKDIQSIERVESAHTIAHKRKELHLCDMPKGNNDHLPSQSLQNSNRFFEFYFQGFTNSSDLNKHMRVHDPNLKIKCEHCDKTFAQRVNLRNHVARHHSNAKKK